MLDLWGGPRRLPGPPCSETLTHRIYLHSTLKLSTNAVTVPLALIVIWNVSCTRKLLPEPWPIMRKLFTKVVSNPTLPLNSS